MQNYKRMNKKQREFLLSRVAAIYDAEKKAHSRIEPSEPNLSNYLVAEILDGSFKMKSNKSIGDLVRKRVLKLGRNKPFLTGDSSYRFGDDDNGDCIFMKALDLFEAPKAYLEQMAEYEKAHAVWEEKNRAIRTLHESLVIKIQLGSDAVLGKLVQQADNLGELNLINTQLTIQVDKQLGR